MKKPALLFFLFAAIFFSACNQDKIENLESQVRAKNKVIKQLEEQLDHAQNTTNSLLDRMSDLSIVNKEGAQSIRKSLENITEQYSYIQELNTKVQEKDSLNLALVMNLKRSLSNINDEDVQIEVKGGIVQVSISDKMLFSSGSSSVSSAANDVLAKIASIANDHDDLNILVEGHTDDVPISNGCVEDNWDLSAKRATAVVRKLSDDYYVDPQRLTAAGRAEFVPKADNSTSEGRSENRRTEILIMPRFDQFFKLMEPPRMAN